ncbi:hypothetical protein [Halobellus rarus]|uniref:Uncharacterized protein n=1 Tax=Halobellus rarus TaxID=1126237 RepID=A0ABD6CQG7_9EURY|nr:hypothetical protein [Halobellus rarus]
MVLKEELETTINRLEENIRQYNQFVEWLDKAGKDWSNRTEAEQTSFLERIEDYEQYQENEIPPDQIKEIRQELEEAYKEPLIEALRTRIDKFLSIIDLELSEVQLDRIVSRIVDNNKSTLDSARGQFDDHLISVDALDEIPRKYVRSEIQRDPSLLSSPGDELNDILNETTESYEQLKSLSGLLSEYTWIPEDELPLQHSVDNYPYLSDNTDVIRKQLDKLDEVAAEFSSYDINLEEVYREQIGEILTQDVSNISTRLSTVAEDTDELLQRQPLLESIEQISKTDNLDDSTTNNLIETYSRTKGKEYNEVQDLKLELSELSSTYERWQKHIIEEWETTASIVKTYCNQFEFDPPAEFNQIDEFSTALSKNPKEAVNILIRTREWISGRNSELETELETATIELLRELIEQGEVWLGDYDIEAVEGVQNSIPIKLTIYDK